MDHHGEWMKITLRFAKFGILYIVPLTKKGLQLIFIFPKEEIKIALISFLKKLLTIMEFLKKLISIKAVSNTAGIMHYNQKHGSNIEIRQCKYLNNIVEQGHRKIIPFFIALF